MTEAEWLTGTDSTVLQFGLQQTQLSIRKIRLFRVACCLHLWGNLTIKQARDAVKKADAYLDGRVSDEEMNTAYWDGVGRFISYLSNSSRKVDRVPKLRQRIDLAGFAIDSSGPASGFGSIADSIPFKPDSQGYSVLRQVPASIMRDIFGNPFRSITLDRSWLSSTVTTLARQMYESRDFSNMPILADALQDAGCDNEDLLNHCRKPGEHVRGCWAVDLVLGRE